MSARKQTRFTADRTLTVVSQNPADSKGRVAPPDQEGTGGAGHHGQGKKNDFRDAHTPGAIRGGAATVTAVALTAECKRP